MNIIGVNSLRLGGLQLSYTNINKLFSKRHLDGDKIRVLTLCRYYVIFFQTSAVVRKNNPRSTKLLLLTRAFITMIDNYQLFCSILIMKQSHLLSIVLFLIQRIPNKIINIIGLVILILYNWNVWSSRLFLVFQDFS